jgi:hypothetical protein
MDTGQNNHELENAQSFLNSVLDGNISIIKEQDIKPVDIVNITEAIIDHEKSNKQDSKFRILSFCQYKEKNLYKIYQNIMSGGTTMEDIALAPHIHAIAFHACVILATFISSKKKNSNQS